MADLREEIAENLEVELDIDKNINFIFDTIRTKVDEIKNPYTDPNPADYSDLSVDHRDAFWAAIEAVREALK